MARELNSHLDDGDIEKYSMGGPRDSEAASLEEHLLICEHCQQRLAESDVYVADMRGAAAHLDTRQKVAQDASERPRWNWLRLIPALAGVALLVIVIGWWSGGSDLSGPP